MDVPLELGDRHRGAARRRPRPDRGRRLDDRAASTRRSSRGARRAPGAHRDRHRPAATSRPTATCSRASRAQRGLRAALARAGGPDARARAAEEVARLVGRAHRARHLHPRRLPHAPRSSTWRRSRAVAHDAGALDAVGPLATASARSRSRSTPPAPTSRSAAPTSTSAAGPARPPSSTCAREHQDALRQPIWGWLGPPRPVPHGAGLRAGGRASARSSRARRRSSRCTRSRAGVELVERAGIERDPREGRSRSPSYAIALADAWLAALGVAVASPRDAARRGAHVALAHPDAAALCRRARDARRARRLPRPGRDPPRPLPPHHPLRRGVGRRRGAARATRRLRNADRNAPARPARVLDRGTRGRPRRPPGARRRSRPRARASSRAGRARRSGRPRRASARSIRPSRANVSWWRRASSWRPRAQSRVGEHRRAARCEHAQRGPLARSSGCARPRARRTVRVALGRAARASRAAERTTPPAPPLEVQASTRRVHPAGRARIATSWATIPPNEMPISAKRCQPSWSASASASAAKSAIDGCAAGIDGARAAESAMVVDDLVEALGARPRERARRAPQVAAGAADVQERRAAAGPLVVEVRPVELARSASIGFSRAAARRGRAVAR